MFLVSHGLRHFQVENMVVDKSNINKFKKYNSIHAYKYHGCESIYFPHLNYINQSQLPLPSLVLSIPQMQIYLYYTSIQDEMIWKIGHLRESN